MSVFMVLIILNSSNIKAVCFENRRLFFYKYFFKISSEIGFVSGRAEEA